MRIKLWAATLMVAALGLTACAGEDVKGPRGRITQKMWVQEFWQAGEQLYPARFCLELNYRDEVCIPESNWNNYSVGDWYK